MATSSRAGSFDISLSSSLRVSPTTTTSSYFTVPVKYPYSLPIKSCRLKSASIPNTPYRIITGVNDTIDFNDTLVVAATIAPGSYSASGLIAAIQTAMNAVSSNFTVTYSSTTFLITFTRTSNFTLLFATGANLTKSMAPILGFTATDTTVAMTATGTKAINLASPIDIYISIAEIGTPNIVANGLLYTFYVPLIGQPGDITTFNEKTNFEQCVAMSTRSLSKLTISVADINGAAVSFNGADFSLLLCFEY